MDFRNFIYTKDDDDLAFLPKELSPGFGTGSPFASVNTEIPKDVEEPEGQPTEVTTDLGESPKADVFVVHPGSVAARIKERKCKTRGGSSRPLVKRKLASMSSSSRVVHAKKSTSKDDDPILSISDDDEGLPDCFELKDANVCHLKISTITPLAWKRHLDNQIDLELLDLHDHCYARQAVVDNAVNRRALLRKKISLLIADVKEHKEAEKARLEAVEASLRREVEELKQDRRDVVSKVIPYAALEFVHSDELGRLVGTLVSSAITYGRCRAYEHVAAMKEPFDLSNAKEVASLIEALLSKKPLALQKPAPSRTQIPVPSSQKATMSFAPSSNPMSPPADLVKPSPPLFERSEGSCVAEDIGLTPFCSSSAMAHV
ncbi:hypothetical protein Tco_1094916 [Tanacetum coccineum]